MPRNSLATVARRLARPLPWAWMMLGALAPFLALVSLLGAIAWICLFSPILGMYAFL